MFLVKLSKVSPSTSFSGNNTKQIGSTTHTEVKTYITNMYSYWLLSSISVSQLCAHADVQSILQLEKVNS